MERRADEQIQVKIDGRFLWEEEVFDAKLINQIYDY